MREDRKRKSLRERPDGETISGKAKSHRLLFDGLKLTSGARVFTYAKRWDYFLLVAAGLAAIGGGIVSLVAFEERPWDIAEEAMRFCRCPGRSRN